MANQTKTAGTGASSSIVASNSYAPASGYIDWINPNNITADDGSVTTVSFPNGAGLDNASKTLLANNFGFTIPAGATINGVEFDIRKSSTGSFPPQDLSIRMIVSGSASGADKGSFTTWTGLGGYGGAADLWGNTLTPEIINASSFGIGIELVPFSVGGTQQAATASVDVITCIVTYTLTVPNVATSIFTAISSTRATGNGQLVSTGGAPIDVRGFVYSTSSQALPSNVSPASSGYSLESSQSGSFPIGDFTLDLTGLAQGVTIYARAYAHNSVGYSYGNEVSFTTLGATISNFINIDPPVLVKRILDFYKSLGGQVTYTSGSVDLSGQSLNFLFNTETILDGLNRALKASPDYYMTVDLGSNVLTFKKPSQTADFVFIKGVHIEKLKLVVSTQELVNKVYFSGGEVTAGVNFYKVYEDSSSIKDNGQRISRTSDNRVIVDTTANAMGLRELNNKKSEKHHTAVTILASTMDITLLQCGKTVSFRGFGNFADSLILQIVRVEYTSDEVTLYLGILPRRLSIEMESMRRGLIAEQTIANPSLPS